MTLIVKVASFFKFEYDINYSNRVNPEGYTVLTATGLVVALITTWSFFGAAYHIQSYPFLIAGLSLLFLLQLNKRETTVYTNTGNVMLKLTAVSLLVVFGDLGLQNLNGLFGIYDLPWITGIILSVIITLSIIHSFQKLFQLKNLTTGIGLIGSYIFALWFWIYGFYSLSVLSFVISGVLTGYLIVNAYSPGLRSGELVTTVVGLLISFLYLQLLNVNENPVFGPSMVNGHVFALSVVLIPVTDGLKNWFMIILANKSPHLTRKKSAYCQLLQAGFSKDSAVFLFWMATLLIIGAAYLFRSLEIHFYLFTLILLSLIIIPAMKSFIQLLNSVFLRKITNSEKIEFQN